MRASVPLTAKDLVVAVSLALVMLAAATARADSRVHFLSDRLKYPPEPGQLDDFRVRTNAALALGATNDDMAVAPLCGGLDDPSDVVRQAAAVGLKRLGRASAVDCLKRRVTIESKAPVRLEIQHALEALDAAGGDGKASGNAAPAAVEGARYYVALSPVTNNSSRSTAEVERIVRDAIAARLSQLGEYQLAPLAESNAAAKAAIAKRKLKGYYLGIGIDRFDYSDGNLRVRVRIAVFSYPGKDLRGEVPAGATLPGARPGDRGAEDQLLTVVAGQAAELFAQNFK
jgi:hypothetical protein